ncbi:hypothetical protein Zmor_008899, partial [Zophobas morio]
KPLCEDSSFSERRLAALLVSKIYYHLGNYKDSLKYVLLSGETFNVNEDSQYTGTMISKAIQQYVILRCEPPQDLEFTVNSRLEQIVDLIFEKSLNNGQFRHVIGIALESRRTDIFERAIVSSRNQHELLKYSLFVCMNFIQSRNFRNTVLEILVKLFMSLEHPDYVNICHCLIHLDDTLQTASMIGRLLIADEKSLLLAFQLCLDIYESASQHFISALSVSLQKEPQENATFKENLDRALSILSGKVTINIHREFLFRNNKTDLLILYNYKQSCGISAVCHNAIVLAHAYMQAGTTDHKFLQENLEWLGRAQNWAKFSATATLGVIHRGQIRNSRNILSSYLPRGNTSSIYTEGGSLFAYGLIHANHGDDVRGDLLEYLKESSVVEVLHGASLGVGAAMIATSDKETDSAIAGEAAAIGMGLVLLGTAEAECVDQMLQYARVTQHEKIIRGIALGIAFLMYGREEEADPLISELCKDKDSVIRMSGMHTIAMSYVGTGNKKAILRLLHYAVSDVSDDVRRTAVSSLGFLLFRTPEQCPSLVSLLAESYNPHVRYGAAMALGVSCAGTGLREAVTLLEPMTSDAVEFVRQGALIALGIVLIRQSEARVKKAGVIRKLFEKVINDKHEGPLAKMGGILGQGIIDAGGRNVTISLESRTGHTSMKTAVGLLLFQQFWYWFPLANFLSLAFTSTALIGLNKELKMPALEFKSNCKPAWFAYPSAIQKPHEAPRSRFSSAILSFTERFLKKRERRDLDKEAPPSDVEEHKMHVDSKELETEKEALSEMEEPKESKGEKATEKEAPAELTYELLSNPAAVAPEQLKYVVLPPDSRYRPIRELGGIVLLEDTTPDAPAEFVEFSAPQFEKQEDEKDEPEPPQPFEYDEDEETTTNET